MQAKTLKKIMKTFSLFQGCLLVRGDFVDVVGGVVLKNTPTPKNKSVNLGKNKQK